MSPEAHETTPPQTPYERLLPLFKGIEKSRIIENDDYYITLWPPLRGTTGENTPITPSITIHYEKTELVSGALILGHFTISQQPEESDLSSGSPADILNNGEEFEPEVSKGEIVDRISTWILEQAGREWSIEKRDEEGIIAKEVQGRLRVLSSKRALAAGK